MLFLLVSELAPVVTLTPSIDSSPDFLTVVKRASCRIRGGPGFLHPKAAVEGWSTGGTQRWQDGSGRHGRRGAGVAGVHGAFLPVVAMRMRISNGIVPFVVEFGCGSSSSAAQGALRAARQELLDPSKAWWGGRRGRFADRRCYPISVSPGVVPPRLARSARSFRTASAPTRCQRAQVNYTGRGPGTGTPFDDAGGDGTARREVAVVVQIRRVLLQLVTLTCSW